MNLIKTSKNLKKGQKGSKMVKTGQNPENGRFSQNRG